MFRRSIPILALESSAAKVSAALLIAALCAPSPPPAAAQVKAPAKAAEFLFVQTAKNVAYRDGVLTLQGVSPVTVFFSDRPERIVGHVRNDVFFREWAEGHNSFKNDPPNAVLSIVDGKTRPTGAVVVLNNPRVDGNNLFYDVRALSGTLPTTGGEGTLFIDGSSGYCDPGYDRGDPGYPCWAQKAFAGGAP
jgi:hypothetical protein